MNVQQKQRVFESNNLTAILLKISETNCHHRNLTLISNRSACLTTFRSQPHNKPKPDPTYIFKKRQDDFKFSTKLSLIKSKKPHPLVDNGFLKIDHNHQVQAEKQKKELLEKIEKENWNFLIRMNNAQPFLSSRSMDIAYKRERKKIKLQKSRQAKMTFPILGRSLSQTKLPFSYSSKQADTHSEKKKTKDCRET